MSNFCGGFDFGPQPSQRAARGVQSNRERGQQLWGKQRQNGCSSMEKPGQGQQSSSSSSGLATRTLIKDLTPHQPNTLIVGIVVTKQSVHSFPDKKNPGAERFKTTFTIRDSPGDYINTTCWGSEDFIRGLHDSFKICDVVELSNAQILSKLTAEFEDRWKPWTPSQYQLNISETHSSVSLYNGWDYTEFTALAHIPLRTPTDFCSLSEITTSGQSMDGSHVHILAAIKHLGSVKQMTSRNGKPLKKCEVKLMDQGCPNFTLFIWDEDLIELSQTWTPKENIIFAVDVKVTYDSYRNCMVATCDQRTVITTNPDCREAHQLYQFAQSVELGPTSSSQDDSFSRDNQENVDSISQVLSVEQLLSEQTSSGGGGGEGECKGAFTGILFALLTTLEIDSQVANTVAYRCLSCRFRVEMGASECSNKSCATSQPMQSGGPSFTAEPNFNLLVSFSDHTGGIDGVRLSGQAAADTLQCTPLQFLSMSDSQRTELKCSLLLERFKIYFKSYPAVGPNQKRPVVRVLAMTLADPTEAAQHLQFM